MKKIRVSGKFQMINGREYIEIIGGDDMVVQWYYETDSQKDWEDFWRSEDLELVGD